MPPPPPSAASSVPGSRQRGLGEVGALGLCPLGEAEHRAPGAVGWQRGAGTAPILMAPFFSPPSPRSLPVPERHGSPHAEQPGLALRAERGAPRGRQPGGRFGQRSARLGLRLGWAGRRVLGLQHGTPRGAALSLHPDTQGLCQRAAGAAARSWPKSGNNPNKLYQQAGEMEVVAASKL